MKDYRQYLRAYSPKEWEDNKEWLGKRLEFIWTFGDYYPQLYRDRGFGKEKNYMYEYYGSDNEVGKVADHEHYGQYQTKKYESLKNENPVDVIEEYIRLKIIKNDDMDKFLRKRIYIKYCFYDEFIEDYLQEEYNEYINHYK